MSSLEADRSKGGVLRLAQLAGLAPTPATVACYRALPLDVPEDYRQLAALLVDDWQRRDVASVGIGGGQGAGKSTLARLLVRAGALRGRRVAVLGLDDFYLTRAERGRLAATVHPLFATRGPPGTHDAAKLLQAVKTLKGRSAATVAVPRFDKGADDRSGAATLRGPVDTVAVEGWCIGAIAAEREEVATPVNALERDEDADGRWRRTVDAALSQDYAALLRELDELVFLAVPDLDAVLRWRTEQEQERAPSQRMTAAGLVRFVQHYERITRRMLSDLPSRADVLVTLDAGHRVADLRWRKPSARTPQCL